MWYVKELDFDNDEREREMQDKCEYSNCEEKKPKLLPKIGNS